MPARRITTRAEARAWAAAVRADGGRVGLVPTMGALHAAHTSLVEIAQSAGARVALSVFVNPLQFGPGEDFERYPRDLEADFVLAAEAGAELVFAPAAREMYPEGEPWIVVEPVKGADRLCGLSRPGHFRGVLTVVQKLFGIFTPDVAVFGQKDYQQLTLLRRMVRDLDGAVEIAAAPIMRDPDGLAMSSRNRYLDPAQRDLALALPRALAECARAFEAGERRASEFRRRLHQAGGTGVSLEYGEVVDPATLEPLEAAEAGAVCLLAARVGTTRLIDNVILGSGSPF